MTNNNLIYSPWYRIGRYEGAIRMALINLKHGHIEDGMRTLREVLAQTKAEDEARTA